MTLTNNVVAKFAVAFVAVAMMFSAIAPVASAQNVSDMSLEELIAMVTTLQSQLGQSGTTGGSTTTTTGTSYTFTRDLTLGSEGADVTALQNWLIAQGQTIPAGATGYFGAQTQSALAAWQAANGISPAAGYFGPVTRAAVAAAAPVDEDEDEDDEDNGGPVSLSGEGELTTFEVSDEEDEVGEGASETVAMLTLEAEDGDVELSRLTMKFDGAGNDEVDPWDAFEMVELMMDGEMVAEFDASDEDAYLDEDAGTFRFSGMDLVLEEDTEVELEVVATAAGSVDGSDTPGNAEWDLTVLDVRYFDADGVATDADDIDELDTSAATVTFDITEEGSDDDATIESSTNDPDAATLRVEDDTSESDEFTVFAFEIEVDEDSSDLVLGDAVVSLTVANPAGGVASFTADDVIADVYLTIDGEKIKGDEAAAFTTAIANSASQAVAFTFEFDEDVELTADEVYEAELSVVFEGRDTNAFDLGTTIVASVNGATGWELEGLEGDNVLTGSETSETHTLAEVVPVISDVTSEVDRNENGSAGTISFEFTVEADGDDDYNFVFADVAAVDGTVDDVRFTTTGTDLTIDTAAITKVSGDATANGTTGWTINDGDEATFVLDVTFTTVNAGDNGTYRVVLDTIGGVEVDETSAGMSLTFVAP